MALSPRDRLAVLTSGGDAPGMNAVLRAATRVGHALGLELVGIEDGYRGLVEGRTCPLDLLALDEAARRGGTVIGTARCLEFATPAGRQKAIDTLARERVRALLVVGGNGSLTGALTLEGADVGGAALAVAGVPASIDNDIAGTSMSVGVDTALNTIVDAVDRLCDTAAAHRRAFLIEVMGRECGYLAMTAGVAVGADSVLVPEVGRSESEIVEQVVCAIRAGFAREQAEKRRVIVIKAEGVRIDVNRLKGAVDEQIAALKTHIDTRVSVLGHIVRGGNPSGFDRLLGARLGNAAVRALADGQSGFMAGWMGPGVARQACPYDPYVVLTPIREVLDETRRLMAGESELARWRRATFQRIDEVLLAT
jgi:6-phosphofructokinase 1